MTAPAPIPIGLIVRNRAADRTAHAQHASTGQRQQHPGWLVGGLFLPADDGRLTCVDYRVRAIPNLNDMEWALKTWPAMRSAMTQQHGELPPPTVTPGGIPRYVFEQASQVAMLKVAQEKAADSDYVMTAEVRGLLLSDGRKRTGRPPARGLAEKLRILRDVEEAFTASESLKGVAARWCMSRSGLRNLLSWARKDSSPRLFTNPGQGQRGGSLTPEAHALLDEIERTAE